MTVSLTPISNSAYWTSPWYKGTTTLRLLLARVRLQHTCHPRTHDLSISTRETTTICRLGYAWKVKTQLVWREGTMIVRLLRPLSLSRSDPVISVLPRRLKLSFIGLTQKRIAATSATACVMSVLLTASSATSGTTDPCSMAAMGAIEMDQGGCAGHGFAWAVKNGQNATASMRKGLVFTSVADALQLARTRGIIGIMVERDLSGSASVSAVDARTTTPCLKTATEARGRALTGGSVNSMSRSPRLRGGMCAERVLDWREHSQYSS